MRSPHFLELDALRKEVENEGDENPLIFKANFCKFLGHRMKEVKSVQSITPHSCPRCVSKEYERVKGKNVAKCGRCGTEYDAEFSYESKSECARIGCNHFVESCISYERNT